MTDLAGRKVFKVFNQDFIVDERYNVTKELGQGAYGIVWYVTFSPMDFADITAVGQAVEGTRLISGLIVLRPTIKPAKGWLSRKLQMFSAKRFSPRGR
jgi:mitogen-activated protein kinase 7